MPIGLRTDDPLSRRLLVAWGLFVSFRLIALPLLLASFVLARRHGRRDRRAFALRIAFFLALLSPVDLNVLGSYRDGGHHRSGPRLVATAVGMPRHTDLIARYGEYYSLGCSAYTMNPPRWMLVPF